MSDLLENIFILCILILLIMAPIGYAMNLYGFFTCDFQAPYKAEVIRGIGVVNPAIGCITGWINLGQ